MPKKAKKINKTCTCSSGELESAIKINNLWRMSDFVVNVIGNEYHVI
jgi:hypothetical protein